MDMKKKLEEAYNPEQNTRKEKILIGLSGGISSYVSAYLLSLQKYDLVAVTVVSNWDDSPVDLSDTFSCHISSQKLDEIKEFCHRLGFAHHTVKASTDFFNDVIDPWMGTRVLGKMFDPCWSCHDLRMRVLYAKLQELEIKKLATGHMAKVLHHEGHKTCYVHSSNDESHDHSAFLARLPVKVLECLHLPLADLTKKEVLKLSENFGLKPSPVLVEVHHCLPWSGKLTEYLQTKIPVKFLQPGSQWLEDEVKEVGNHEGVIHHDYGQALDFYKNDGRLHKAIFGRFTLADKQMHFYAEDYLFRTCVLVQNCSISQETSWLEPLQGFMMLSDATTIECWIRQKSLNSVFVEWPDPARVTEGSSVCIYKKKGKNSKVLLTGKIRFLEKPKKLEEGEKSVPQADYSRDF